MIYDGDIAAPKRNVSSLILASRSPRRRELLNSLGLEVFVVPSQFQEMDVPGMQPLDLARSHAQGKALDVSAVFPGALVVGADTVVDLDGASLGKPRDAAEARRMLHALSGRTHRVHTAFAVHGLDEPLERVSSTDVRFYPLTEREIDAYLATGDSMDKAGAYGIQGAGASLVERIDGDFYTVMGFPLGLFVRSLAERGITLGRAG